jgi:carboxyl-terminal processing protease
MPIAKSNLVLGATAATVAAVTLTGAGIHLSQGHAFFQENPKEVIDEVWQIVDRLYVDGTFNQVDWQAVRQDYLNREYTQPDAAYKAIREMLEKLGDPYTRFMDPDEFRNMQIDTSGELTGVGLQLGEDKKTKELVVVSPIDGSPAAKAGILAKDKILEIDGKSTKGMDINAAVKLIRGPVGTKVVLTLQRGDRTMSYTLERAKIELHSVTFSERPGDGSAPIGYIRLTQFSANAAPEMRDAIQKLEAKNVAGYVLDLRSNPGGLLYASIDIARMWMNEGVIVSTVDRNGETDRQQANRSALTQKPVVVLVDGGSASASEILSGALQDNKRAIIIGTKTFGKGLVQSVRSLGDGSGMAVTVAKYLTPSGRDINKHGIDPDIEVKLTDEQREFLGENRDKIGTLEDAQYAKALEVLQSEIAKANSGTRAAAPQ